MRQRLIIRRHSLAPVIAISLAPLFGRLAIAAELRVFILDAAQLHAVREKLQSGDQTLAPALEQLKRDADAALRTGPFSVVNKEAVPPSGDKHDYMSFAPYWWPDPKLPTGLPYIRRDGERNPDIYKIGNRLDLGEFADALDTLSLAFYFTDDERYAARAALLVRTWFLDPATRMNPNLEFGQSIPGVNTGRGAGLIETRMFARVVDSIGLIEHSAAWTDEDQRGMRQWFENFLTWMLTSEIGREEAAAQNNHGTYYDMQVASYALFLDNRDLAAKILRDVGQKRIATQIAPDGRQPLELARTKAWSYSVGNLAGLMTLARLAEHIDVDLWNFKTEDGASIRAALDFLAPFATEERSWTYQQINGFDAELLHPLLHKAAAKYPDANYRELLTRLPQPSPISRANLLLSPLDSISQLHKR
ncbi:MAG TPA: alginate lyase family protein [Lacipirellulaceae bacterium]|nr:alginate lyase family protein [Lacipirellulaceae bacterium]